MTHSKRHIGVQAALSGKVVLLTGSTGFLAKVILEKLLRAVPDVACVVLLLRRGADGADARQRFERDIAASSVFDRLRAERPAWLAQFFAERIECLTGEVTQERCGLDAASMQALAARVDVVINAAASVNFREPLDAALSINTLSLHHLSSLALAAGAALVQVSTCYVNGYQRGEMREKIVAPAGAAIPRRRAGYYDVEALIANLQKKIAHIKASCPDPKQQRQRLTELGIAEANRYGWNDTYTFTKWLGEQVALRGMHGHTLSIVRPAIIESTLQEPVPGWIEGVKVADAIILAYARGKTRIFPARPQGIIDIVPADLVANAILLATAEALANPLRRRVYQACTGLGNPIRLGRVIDLLQTESKRNWRAYERLFYAEPKHNFTLVGRTAFLLMLRASGAGLALWHGLRSLLGAPAEPEALQALRTTQTLALTFSFYTAPRYRFHNTQLLALAQRFSAAERQSFPVDARLIDWEDYLCRVHMAGLNRYALRARPAPSPALEIDSAGAPFPADPIADR